MTKLKPKEALRERREAWRRGEPLRLFWLLIVLVALFLAYPFFVHRPIIISVFNLFQSAALLVTIYAVSRRARYFAPVAAVFTVFAALTWLDLLVLNSALLYLVIIPGWAAFYAFAVYAVLARVVRNRRIALDEISGAVSAYVLIGLFFSTIFVWVEILHRGSFYIAEGHNANGIIDYSDFVLFSFTTLTTLGYGNITPVTHLAQVLAVLEAIIGVVYVAVLVAGLVGMMVARRLSDVDREQRRLEREVEEEESRARGAPG